MKISGYVCVRNGDALDYCFRLAVSSLLGVCDEVVVSESESTDGTREFLDDWASREANLRIVNYPWPNPKGDIKWWTNWLNHARAQLKYPMQLALDADEMLDPASYPAVLAAAERGECRWFERLNFWRDAQHLCPHGRVCGEQVVRLGPTELWMCSDEPHPEGEPELRIRAGWPPNADRSLRIFHYGFLRKEKAFIEKVRTVNGAFFDTFDDRVAKAEQAGTPWVDEVFHSEVHDGVTINLPLLPFNENHPKLAHEWLRNRGYTP